MTKRALLAIVLIISTIPAMAWQFPVHPADYWTITSPYGYRISPFLDVALKHEGIDIAAVHLAQVIAARAGTIIEHWPPPGTPTRDGSYFRGHPVFGGYLVIDHDDGWTSHYAHLSVTFRRTGERVASAQVIGRMGNTGVTTGHHLHFELRHNGEPVNPLLYIPLPEKNF